MYTRGAGRLQLSVVSSLSLHCVAAMMKVVVAEAVGRTNNTFKLLADVYTYTYGICDNNMAAYA